MCVITQEHQNEDPKPTSLPVYESSPPQELVLEQPRHWPSLHATRAQAHRESKAEIPRPNAACPPRWSEKSQLS